MNPNNIDFEEVKKIKLLDKKNVESYFAGFKEVKGNTTQEKCIVVGVSKKESLESLPKEDLVPSEISGVKTDVIEVPKMIVYDFCGGDLGSNSPSEVYVKGCPNHTYDNDSPFECIPGGISIGPKSQSSAGTLGFSLKDENGNILGVTNNHVVGPEVHYAKDDSDIEYNVNWVASSEGNIYTIYDNETQDLFFKPAFDGSTNNLPKLDVGKKYIFKTSQYLDNHPFFISTASSGGPSNQSFAYTDVTIKNANGLIIYQNGSARNGSGRNDPYALSNESLEFEYSSQTFSSQFYYQCWYHSNMGNKLDLIFSGVPYCLSSNHSSTTSEYNNGELLELNKNTLNEKVVSPSNIDVGGNGGQGQKDIGFVFKNSVLKFNHPQNSTLVGNHGDNYSNKIDASLISFYEDSVPVNKIQSLFSGPFEFTNAETGMHVYKSGRSTGVTPTGGLNSQNKSTILSTSWSGNVYYCPSNYIHNDGSLNEVSSVQHIAQFEDCVLYLCNGEWFSDSGDSGSGIFTYSTEGETPKLIGLHFAGATSQNPLKSYGIACKIENIVSELSVSTWSGERSIQDTYINNSESIKICDDCYVISNESDDLIGYYKPQSQPQKYQNGESCENS
tara:strand:- start:1698 stop:3539 length:1842 start_codon:yes stop_codon:yes gene_type:complete